MFNKDDEVDKDKKEKKDNTRMVSDLSNNIEKEKEDAEEEEAYAQTKKNKDNAGTETLKLAKANKRLLQCHHKRLQFTSRTTRGNEITSLKKMRPGCIVFLSC